MLDFNEKVEDGFVDAGRNATPRSAASCRRDVLDLDGREVLHIDFKSLAPRFDEARRCVSTLTSPREKFKAIAVLVSDWLGGAASMYDEAPTEAQLRKLKQENGNNVVGLHQLTSGVCRHRAVAFKLLCGQVGLQARLVRGDYVGETAGGHAWNVVRIDQQLLLCDVMHAPGSLYETGSAKAKHYQRLNFDELASHGGAGMHSVPMPPPHDPGLISRSDLEAGEELGRGGFGVVLSATWKGHTEVAVKTIYSRPGGKVSKQARDDFEHELGILQQLRHPNVVQLMGWNLGNRDDLFFVTELMELGSLHSCLEQRGSEYGWTGLGRQVALDALRGLCYLHTLDTPIAHFDIKTQNILICARGRGKLADVGISKTMLHTVTSPHGHTVGYTAPEILLNEGGNERSDVFSFGVVLCTIYSRKEPKHGSRVAAPEGCPALLRTLVNGCLARQPEDRLTSIQALEQLRPLSEA